MTWYQWILPVAAGSFLGWAVSRLLVGLLLRPAKEIRFLGKRRYGPGMNPARKTALARRIAAVVSDELITVESMRERIARAGFDDSLRRSLAEAVAKLGGVRIGSLLRTEGRALSAGTRSAALTALSAFLGSPVFAEVAREVVKGLVDGAFSARIADLVEVAGDGGGQSAYRSLAVAIIGFLGSDESRAGFRRAVACWLDARVGNGDTVASSLSLDAPRLADGLMAALYPHLVKGIHGFLNRPEIRAELEFRGRLFMKEAILKLTFFQRLFVTAGQYDKTIDEKMPEIIDDLIDALTETAADGRNAVLVRDAAASLLDDWGKKRLGDLLDEPASDLRAKILGAVDRVPACLAKGEENAIVALAAVIEDNRERSVGELAAALRIAPENLAARLADAASRALRPSAILDFAERFLNNNGGTEVAAALGVSESDRTRLVAWLSTHLRALIGEHMPGILNSVDVASIVTDGIEKMDASELAGVLFDLASDRIKWLGVSGALAGALIGTAAAALSRFGT
jgi:hypothetical protein